MPQPPERLADDPRYLQQAAALAHAWNSEPLAWRLQEDGSLTVVVVSGPKLNSNHLPTPPSRHTVSSSPVSDTSAPQGASVPPAAADPASAPLPPCLTAARHVASQKPLHQVLAAGVPRHRAHSVLAPNCFHAPAPAYCLESDSLALLPAPPIAGFLKHCTECVELHKDNAIWRGLLRHQLSAFCSVRTPHRTLCAEHSPAL